MRWWSDSAGTCHTCSKPLCQSSLAGGPPPQQVWSPAQVSSPQIWGTWSRSVPDDCRRLWTWLSPALRRPDMFPWQRPFLTFITKHKLDDKFPPVLHKVVTLAHHRHLCWGTGCLSHWRPQSALSSPGCRISPPSWWRSPWGCIPLWWCRAGKVMCLQGVLKNVLMFEKP